MARRAKSSGNELSRMAISLFEKVRQIKKSYPHVSRNIDNHEKRIRGHIEAIKTEIAKLNKEDRNLVTIMVINGIQRTAEEVLID
jgi:hypothetical protein